MGATVLTQGCPVPAQDPNGRDFHIHDTRINNDDDSIAVKPLDARGVHSDCTRNLLIENMSLTGFGASIGSVPPHADVACVRNVTFRNISMPGTGKGIYVKSNPSCGLDVDRFGKTVQKTSILEGITFEDVRMDKPWWWAIWIGPQQQQEPHQSLGDKCSLEYGLPLQNHCPTQGCATFANITLRNVQITDPLLSPGVVLGNASNPMTNITFDGVTVDFGANPLRGRFPWGREYKCEHAGIASLGATSPKPACA